MLGGIVDVCDMSIPEKVGNRDVWGGSEVELKDPVGPTDKDEGWRNAVALRLEGLLPKFVGTNSLAVARISPRGFSSTSNDATEPDSSTGGGSVAEAVGWRNPGGTAALKVEGADMRPLPYEETVESSAMEGYCEDTSVLYMGP